MADTTETNKVMFRDSKTDEVIEKTGQYENIRTEICDREGISRTQFESRFSVEKKKKFISFSNPPWSDFDDLESDIKSLKSVRSAFYIPPLRGSYGPPKFVIDVNSTTDNLRDQVEEYYDGLTVKVEDGRTCIIISPTENKK